MRDFADLGVIDIAGFENIRSEMGSIDPDPHYSRDSEREANSA